MWNKLQNHGKPQIIFVLFVLMMLGLFISRILLSASLIAFIAYSFFHPHVREQLKKFITTPFLWGMSLLFILPLLSGLWSDDKKEWMDIMRIKLPLLLMPLSFAGSVGLSKKNWEHLAFIFILLTTGGTAWSMIRYLSDPVATHAAYLQSRLIETPLENDHVRFSWLVSIAVMSAAWLALKKRRTRPIISLLLFIIMTWLVIFLHILAARTGLLSFYLIAISFAIWLIIKKFKPLYSAAVLLVIITLPVVAYCIFPTFQNRVKYFFYDLPYFKEAHYLPQTTDAIRVISMKAGWSIMNTAPLTGVGAGDVFSQTENWYGKNYPSMKKEDKIYPSSEWLLYGAGLGWPGFILFTVILAIPFFIQRISNRFFWCLLNISALCLLLFDISLEIQFGVFICSFVLLCGWKRAILET